jgi:hypothetical protein
MLPTIAALCLKLILLFGGIIVAYIFSTDWKKEGQQ